MSYNVVCLEDDWDLSRLIALTIRQWTPCVYVAHDGIQGLSLIRQHCPDLVLLDLGLPGLNGWEVYSEIKKDAALYQIPIIVFTAIPYDEQAMYLNSIGQVSAYILKPVTLPVLRQILEPFFVHNDATSSTKGL